MRIRRIGAWVMIGLLLALALLQTPAVATSVARPLLRAFAPSEIKIEIGSLGWFSFASLDVRDLRITDVEGSNIFSADHLEVDQRLWSFFSGSPSIRLLVIEGGRLTFQDRVGGLWGLGLSAPDGAATVEGAEAPNQPFSVDRIVVEGSLVEVLASGVSPPEAVWADTTVVFDELAGQVEGFRLAADEGLSGLMNTVAFGFRSSVAPQTYRAEVVTAGRLEGRGVTLDSIQIVGDSSSVGGRLAFDWSGLQHEQAVTLAGNFATRTLAPADIRAFAPAWAGQTALQVDLRLSGSVDSIQVGVNATAVGAGGVEGSLLIAATELSRALDWDLEFDDLDPRVVLGPNAPDGTFNGSTHAAVVGARPPEWSGTLAVTLRASRLGDRAVQPSELTLSLNDGFADGNVRLRLPDSRGSTEANGAVSGRILDSIPQYAFAGSIVRRFQSEGQPPTALHTVLEVEGRGIAPEDLTLAATLRADSRERRSQLGRADLRMLEAQLDLRPDEGSWTVESRIASGIASGSGTVQLSQGVTRFTAHELVWDSVDFAAISGDTTASRSSGRARASLELRPGGVMSSRGTAAVAGSRYGDAGIDSARVNWALAPVGELSSDWVAWIESGSVEAHVAGRPLDMTPVLRVSNGAVDAMDLGALWVKQEADRLEPSPLSSALTGTFQGDWTGTEPSGARARLEWQLVDSWINGADSLSARGRLTLEQGTVTAGGSLESTAGGGIFEVFTRPFDTLPTWGTTLIEFVGVQPNEWTKTDANDSGTQPTGLTGTISGAGSGLKPDQLVGDLVVSMDGSVIFGRTVELARMDLELTPSRLDGTVTLQADSIRVEGTGWVELAADSSRYAAALLGWIPATESAAPLRASVEGKGLVLASARASISIAMDSITAWGMDLDSGILEASLAEGLLEVDSLRVVGPTVQLAGQGAVGLASGRSSDFQAEFATKSLEIVRTAVDAPSLFVGEGALSLSVSGPFRSQQVSAVANTSASSFGGVQLLGFQAELEATLAGLETTNADLSAMFTGLGTPTAAVERTEASAHYDGDKIAIDLRSDVDVRRTLELSARVDPDPERRVIEFDRFNASLDDDRWTLAAPATVRYGSTIVVDSLDLRAGEQRLFANGSLSPSGEQDFRMILDGFRIGTVSDLIGWNAVEGVVSGSLEVGGSATEPTVDLTWASELASPQTRAVQLEGDVHLVGTTLDIDASILGQGRRDITLRGTVPVAARVPWSADATRPLFRVENGAVDLSLAADSVALSWLRPFVDPTGFTNVSGALTADLAVGGTAQDPIFDGQAAIYGGAIDFVALGTRWDRINGSGSLGGSSFTLDALSIRSGEGTVSAQGSVDFERLTIGAFDVALEATRFEAVNNSLAKAIVSGRGELGGTTFQPELRGDVRLLSTDLFLGGLEVAGQAANVELTELDYQELEATFGRDYRRSDGQRTALVDSLDVRVNVSMARDTWIRQVANPKLAIQMSGDVEVSKPRGDSISVLGTIDAIPERSYLEQFGRRFSLSEGTVEFRGRPSETLIDIRGSYSIPSVRDPNQAEVTIELGVAGTPQQVQLLLSSTPSMDNSDIVSYLATGRPASEDLGLEGRQGDLADLGTGIAVGVVSNAIESAAAERIGLDVIDIQTDGIEGARLVAGRYVSPSLFVGFKQPLSRGTAPARTQGTHAGTEVEIEYQALRWLLLNLQAGGRGFDFLLRSRVAY